MSRRRRARESALQLLFQHEYLGSNADLDLYWKGREEEPDVKEFASSIFRGTLEHLQEIDAGLEECAEHWELKRMATVDLSLMRLAAYEILLRDDIPHAVTINEALEIAKKFSTTESAAFINGILDKLAKKSKRAR